MDHIVVAVVITAVDALLIWETNKIRAFPIDSSASKVIIYQWHNLCVTFFIVYFLNYFQFSSIARNDQPNESMFGMCKALIIVIHKNP